MAKKKSSQLFRFLLQGDETLASRIKFVPLTNLFPCSKNLKKKIMRILFFHCKKPHASDENFFYIDAKKISALCYQLKVFMMIIFHFHHENIGFGYEYHHYSVTKRKNPFVVK